MKNISKKTLESARPDLEPINALMFCLKSLYRDKKKNIDDDVCEGCTYEELIGALLLAKDVLEKKAKK